MFDKALPLWSTAGLDHRFGGSVEVLDLNGHDGAVAFKRTRVQARQVYAFSHGHLLGWTGPGLASAEHCWTFLARYGRRDDGAWVRHLGREGGVFDPTADAYDIAFVLNALAWRSRVGDDSALSQAHATLQALDRVLAIAPGLGWRTAEDVASPLWQNPHMHLLEAALELADAGRDERFAQMARDILMLFRDRMFDRGLGVLPEYFETGWRPIGGPARQIEPGHQYEWTWLLLRARKLLGLDLGGEAATMFAFAEARGPDPQIRLVEDGLDGDDMTPRRTFRTWPQTEALKANLAMFEFEGLDTRARVAEITGHLLDRYLAVSPAGGWQDRFDGAGQPMATDMPASTLYHVFLAFAELLRLEPLLSQAAPAR